jgi:hypothetical protein
MSLGFGIGDLFSVLSDSKNLFHHLFSLTGSSLTHIFHFLSGPPGWPKYSASPVFINHVVTEIFFIACFQNQNSHLSLTRGSPQLDSTHFLCFIQSDLKLWITRSLIQSTEAKQKPEDRNCNVCRNAWKPPELYATYCRKMELFYYVCSTNEYLLTKRGNNPAKSIFCVHIILFRTLLALWDVSEREHSCLLSQTGKALPVTDRAAHRVVRRRGSTFSRQSAHRWRWGCQPYAPAALYPQEYSWHSFLLMAESSPPGHSEAGRIW